MTTIKPTRRHFVQYVAASSLITTTGMVRAGPGDPIAAAGAVHVRREINSLAANGPEITALKQGIAAMKARPPTDPTSWLFQANIHGTVDPTPAGNAAATKTWRTCQHGSFFFLSWHRMYLYFFERILRAASNEPSLALPYWNYGVPAQRVLPAVFRQPASTANPLFAAQRRQSINAGQPAPPSATGATTAMNAQNFASATGFGNSFGGQILATPSHDSDTHGLLESQPHDVMHPIVGGNGLMTDPDTAARDPIFWLHHANIDRLWAQWLRLGQGRRNPASGPWTTHAFNFVDEHGALVKLTGADIVDQARQLGYRYDDEPTAPAVVAEGAMETEPTVPPAPARVLAATPATEAAAAGLTMSDATFVLRPHTLGAVESAIAPGRGPIVLSIEGIAYRRPLGVYYEVYLNRRPGEPADPDGPYYAGNLSFFALGHAGPEGVTNARATLDVTSVIANQRERGLWSGGEVKIDLHPIDDEPAATESAGPLATIGSMRLLGE